MNEDDTFKKLKQVPFEEVEMVLLRTIGTTKIGQTAELDLQPYGWTKEDYMAEWHERNMRARDQGGFTVIG